MNNVTPEQKKAFIDLAAEYDQRVLQILKRGNDEEAILESMADVQVLEDFADKIAKLIARDYPDDDDKDADMMLVVGIIGKVTYRFQENHPN